MKKPFTVMAGEALTIQVKYPEGASNKGCCLITEDNVSFEAKTDGTVDDDGYTTYTVTSAPNGDFRIQFQITANKEYSGVAYYCNEERYYVFYKRSETAQIQVLSPEQVGFVFENLTFLKWQLCSPGYSEYDDGYQAGDTIPWEENTSVELYSFWSYGDMESADGYPVWINGVKVSEANKNDILGDGAVSYDKATSTISFNHADFSETVIQCPVEGWSVSIGVDLTIEGTVAWGSVPVEINVYNGSLTYKGGTFTSGYPGMEGIKIYAENGMLVDGNNKKDIRGLKFSSKGNVTVVNADLPETDIVAEGDITVKGSVINGKKLSIYDPEEIGRSVLIENSNVRTEEMSLYGAVARFVDSDITIDGVWNPSGSISVEDLFLEGGTLYIYGNGLPSHSLSVANGENPVSFLMKNDDGLQIQVENGMFSLGDGVSFKIPEEGASFFTDWELKEVDEVWIATENLRRVSVDCTMLNLFLPDWEGYHKEDNPCQVYEFFVLS